MRIIKEDLRKGYVKLVPENDEDLWILYNIVEPGDLVEARTTRDVKFRESGSSRRIPMNLVIRVEKTEFQPFTDRLRIRGVVVEGPEEFGIKGKHHTLNIEPGTPLTIWKEKWPSYVVKKLRETSLQAKRLLIASLDYDEACIGLLSEQGLGILNEIRSRLPGKDEPEKFMHLLNNYLSSLAKNISELVEKHGVKILIIASPGDLARRVAKLVSDKLKSVDIIVDSISMGGCIGVNEVLRRDSVKNALKELSIVKARSVLEEFKKYLVKNTDMIAYGLDDVEYAVKNNAVEKLVVITDYLRTYDEEARRRIHNLLEEASRRRAEIIFVPRNNDVYVELSGFGGIIALLRYPLPRPSTYPQDSA